MKQKELRHRKLKLLIKILNVLIVSTILVTISCSSSSKSEGPIPSPTIQTGALQVKDLQTRVFTDFGVSIAYPSEWKDKLISNSSRGITSFNNTCMDTPLMIFLDEPVNISSIGFQNYVDSFLSFMSQRSVFTVISTDYITINNTSMIKAVTSNQSAFSFEMWNIFYFIPSKDNSTMGLITPICRADCWPYYEDAIYKIVGTYQFLD